MKKNLLIAGLIVALGYTSIQVVKLRLERMHNWNVNSRTYMLIQQAYHEGLEAGCKEEEEGN